MNTNPPSESNSKKRVLVLGEFGVRNGGENSLLSVLPSLVKSGWEFHSGVIPDSEFANGLSEIGVINHHFSTKDETGTRKQQSEIRENIADLIARVRPVLIHSNSLATSRLVGPVSAELKIPALGYLRDIMKLSKKAIADINLNDRLIAVSNATRTWHLEQGIEQHKTFVVHNGVDDKVFFPATDSSFRKQLSVELGIPFEKPVLLFVGQIGMRKGVDVLIEAFLKIAQKVSGVRLLIVGERNSQKQEAIEYEQSLHQLVNESDFSKQVHWLGRRTDVANIMRGCDLLIHPARQEPLGRVLLESLASGLVPLTTDVGGSAEILVGDELEKLLLPKDDVVALADQGVSLIENTAQQERLVKLCVERAKGAFGVKACADSLARHYRQISTGI